MFGFKFCLVATELATQTRANEIRRTGAQPTRDKPFHSRSYVRYNSGAITAWRTWVTRVQTENIEDITKVEPNRSNCNLLFRARECSSGK